MTWTLEEVARFAAQAHQGQQRKYTGEPYIVHPAEVARLLEKYIKPPKVVLAAAWLHDVVEDTCVPLSTIAERFGQEVAHLVDELTDKAIPEMGNRKVRKDFERRRLAAVSLPAKHVKLADLLSNNTSIVSHDPKFSEVYLEEKALLLTESLYLPDNVLWRRAAEVITHYGESIRPRWWEAMSDNDKQRLYP